MRGRFCLFFVLALVGLALTAGPASAGGPGSWSRITATNLFNFAEPGLGRTSDGVLHVVWHEPVNAQSESLMHSAVSPAGQEVGNSGAILSGWNSVNPQPDLTVSPDGSTLRVFFAGIHSLLPNDPLNYELQTATASIDGTTWAGPQRFSSSSHTSYASSGIAAAVGSGGVPIAAEGDPGNVFQLGFGGTDYAYESTPGVNVYDPGIGVDASSGQAVLGWFSLGGTSEGTYAQAITPSGLSGSKQFMPNSASSDHRSANPPLQKTAITGRHGANGVYIAYAAGYPSQKNVDLMRFGGSQPIVVGAGNSIANVAIAPAPEGRLWIMWSDSGKIYAARTNKEVTHVGARTTVKAPPGSVSIFGVWGEGSPGKLDLLASSGTATNQVAMWQTQVLPPLDIVAVGGVGVVKVKVTDAGDPLAGVLVTVAGHQGRTGANGIVTIKVGQKSGPVVAKATKPGYKPDTDRTRVKQKKKKK